MTTWNGNDGATWVALVDTTFDAVISPVATLADIVDPGGVLLLDGTKAMEANLDMGGFGIVDALSLTIENPTASVPMLTLNNLTDGGQVFSFEYDDTLNSWFLDVATGRSIVQRFAGVDVFTVSAAGVVADTLLTLSGSTRAELKFEYNPGEDHYIRKDGRYLRIYGTDNSTVQLEIRNNVDGNEVRVAAGDLHVDGGNVILNDGGYVASYDPSPQGGGAPEWYQIRNARFKDTPGPPSDSEGLDGDICFMYQF